MFNLGARVLHLDIGHSMRPALIAKKQAVALRKVPHTIGLRGDADEAAIGAVGFAGGDPLGHNGGSGALAIVDHLRAGIGLLIIIGDGDRIKFSHAVIAIEDAAWIFPGDG